MKLEQNLVDMILSADAKALATCANNEPNVISVSTIRVIDENIWLMNYFMHTTFENLQSNNKVALACWKGFEGVKIKATVTYVTSGNQFENAKKWVAEVAPTRTLKGLLVLSPTAVYDLAPVAGTAGSRIA